MKEHYLAVIKFPMLVSLSLIIIATAFFGIALGNYFKLGLSATETVCYTLFFVILVILSASWVLILMGTHQKLRPLWLELYAKWMLINIYYYLAKWLGRITLQNKTDLEESFLNFNNEIVLSSAKDVSHDNILILLPHCLQKSDCKLRITNDIESCESCGECDIASLKELAKGYNVKADRKSVV